MKGRTAAVACALAAALSDRSDMLVSGAKKEKHLVWYTTLIPTEVSKPLADAFHKKYLYITVPLYGGDSNAVAQKVIQEYRAHSYRGDVVDGTGTATILRKAGLSPGSTSLPRCTACAACDATASTRSAT